ncbi:MAG: sel1 repeat family protein [Anaeroplasmataceae bacterium]|nr:sel1 repeat family protein [Anaeroplasmataceae bacterium]
MNYEEMTIEEIVPFAKQGDMDAQLWLGKKSIGVTSNEEAMHWLEQAANQGLAEAQSLLAEGYCTLSNIKDYKLAKYWFEKAAAQNYPDAIYQLGIFYEKGDYGVPVDIKKALQYFEKAANLGYLDAQLHFGGILHYGLHGVQVDYTKAKYYYELAASQNMREAQYLLGVLYFNGLGVTEDKEKAISFFESAADKLDDAQYVLGWIYAKGEGRPQDYQKGKYYFEKAATQGHVSAQYNLGYLHLNGLGCEKNIQQGKYWLEQAANQGDQDAINLLRELNRPVTSSTSKNGCYVATCVYGSYDCPEVWTLRRYRDNTLAQTWYGRTFIKVYYAISPKLVKVFGNKNWFQRFWKKRLDRKVSKLQRKGVEDTPYEDQDWRK